MPSPLSPTLAAFPLSLSLLVQTLSTRAQGYHFAVLWIKKNILHVCWGVLLFTPEVFISSIEK